MEHIKILGAIGVFLLACKAWGQHTTIKFNEEDIGLLRSRLRDSQNYIIKLTEKINNLHQERDKMRTEKEIREAIEDARKAREHIEEKVEPHTSEEGLKVTREVKIMLGSKIEWLEWALGKGEDYEE